jgi:hypothetical protein
MKEPTKETKRWLLQAEDDFRFVQWIADQPVTLTACQVECLFRFTVRKRWPKHAKI